MTIFDFTNQDFANLKAQVNTHDKSIDKLEVKMTNYEKDITEIKTTIVEIKTKINVLITLAVPLYVAMFIASLKYLIS